MGAPSQLLTMAKWAVERDLFLADFVQRCACPHLALVTKGQYLSVGAPNVANPTLKPYVLIHSTRRLRKALGQVVRVKEGKRKVLTDFKLALPESYSGYFEILSEDGRPVKCLESVEELWKAFPDMCLLRQGCKAYLPDSDGELRSLYRTRTLHEGEVLTLVGQFTFKRIMFLRCFDEFGGSVYLKFNQKAKFSPVAKPDAITGVHSVDNLMNKRLPLTVKLIQGQVPPELQKLAGAGGSLILQLQTVFQEDVVFAYSLQRDDGQFLALPLNAHLKLAPTFNHPQVRVQNEFQRLTQLCDEKLTDFFDGITAFNDQHLMVGQTKEAPEDPYHGEQNGKEQPPVCDEEIDQLYDYIRGLAPLPDSCHESRGSVLHHRGFKPPPPPIETIPSRKSADSSTSRSGGGGANRVKEKASPPLPGSPTTSNADFLTPRDNSSPPGQPQGTHPSDPKRISLERYKRLSKSSERISHGPFLPFQGNRRVPHNFPPTGYPLVGTPDRDFEHLRRPGQSGKRRPLSMVIPDSMAIPRMGPQFYPGPSPSQEFYARNPHPYPGHHPMYHSFANLNMTQGQEEVAPKDSANNNGIYGHAFPSQAPPPPPPFMGFHGRGSVYPRFTPRYHFHPTSAYRV